MSSKGKGKGDKAAVRPIIFKAVVGTPPPAKAADEEAEAPSTVKTFKNPSYKRGSAGGRRKTLKQILAAEKYHLWPVDKPNYVSIAAPPPLIPVKKYCDITGLPTVYTDPKSQLRFYSPEVYAYLNTLPPASVQALLAVRNAAVKLS